MITPLFESGAILLYLAAITFQCSLDKLLPKSCRNPSTFPLPGRYLTYHPFNKVEANKMLIVSEMSAGKILDEACNNNNDVYSDEALYAAWVERPWVAARLLEYDIMAAGKPSSTNFNEGFMAHLYAGKV